MRDPAFETYPAKETQLGSLAIRRALPRRGRRMVGPWCFLDRYGPLTFTDDKPMDVAPHPHIGLQTVSWLLEGEVLHRDSLGCESVIRPGELNLMTSGRAIAHAEETPLSNSHRLSGVQLWVALPDPIRHGAPAFEHHQSLPQWETGNALITLFMGEAAAFRSPATAHSPMVGAEIVLQRNADASLPLRADFEHALFVLEGEVNVAEDHLVPDVLYASGPGRTELNLRSREGARLLLLGGTPFEEEIVMWWNFVARTRDEIAAARDAWERREGFGEVHGYRGPRIEAPPLNWPAPPNPAS
jgi:redox-sensitive bicupin YhaK (pirin superfamily)